MERERISSISKISGGTVEQKEAAIDRFADIFANPEQSKYEREKTLEEKEIIEGVVFEMTKFLQKYGAQSLPISIEHIRILDQDKLNDKEREYFNEKFSSSKGFYRPETQDIWLFAAKMKSPLVLAHSLAHELIHFFSFNARTIKQNGEDQDHRIGLAVQDPKVEFNETSGLNLFNETNEATTEGLVKRFFSRLKHIPALKEEYQQLEEVQKEWDDIAYFNVTSEETGSEPVSTAVVETFGYPELRDADQQLFSEILKKNPDQFASEEEVFDVFARAAMTGDVKHMASLVESLGRGAFRALARRNTPKGT